MAIQAYIKFKANGSDIDGSSLDLNNHDKFCDVHTFSFGALTQRETGTARPTGRRQQEPFVIVKPLDKASPLLFKALSRNENVDAKMEVWRDKPDGGGREHYYTVELVDARIVSLKQYAPQDQNTQSNLSALEEVQLLAKESTITWEDGGITHTENWYNAQT
jgi:type VI secretion system secreted protein Hcp